MATSQYPHISKGRFFQLRKLSQKKFRSSEKLYLIEGMHLVEEAINAGERIQEIMVTQGFLERYTTIAMERLWAERGIPVRLIGQRELEMLADTVTSQGILALLEERRSTLEQLYDHRDRCLVVALDSINDPGNVGTMIRTCDWFGVDGVLLGNETVELYNQKVVRATQGSLFHLPVISDVHLGSALRTMKEKGFMVIGTALKDAVPVTDVKLPPKSVIVLGNEAKGLSPEVRALCDTAVIIPGSGRAESLNVSVACGVVLGVLTI